jgi:tetratricopeptide (TPR) repeat protein
MTDALRVLTVAAAFLLAFRSGAAAQQAPDIEPRTAEAREYAACMQIARADPKAAHESALAWRAKGGGDAAIHCVAVALLGLGQYSQSARMLEELAAQTDAKRPTLKAQLYGQAANAWMIDGAPAMSEKLLTVALAIRPDDVELRIDRAIALGTQAKYWEALDDLNRALESSPDRADALTFRASAWRHVNSAELARQDIDRALVLRPDFPDALLERGLIRQAAGDAAGARADWLRIIGIAVDGPVTEAARGNLEKLDVKTKN